MGSLGLVSLGGRGKVVEWRKEVGSGCSLGGSLGVVGVVVRG